VSSRFISLSLSPVYFQGLTKSIKIAGKREFFNQELRNSGKIFGGIVNR
jgi:hypothetical protein